MLLAIIDGRVVVGGGGAVGSVMVIIRWDELAELVQIWHKGLRHGVVVKEGWSAMGEDLADVASGRMLQSVIVLPLSFHLVFFLTTT